MTNLLALSSLEKGGGWVSQDVSCCDAEMKKKAGVGNSSTVFPSCPVSWCHGLESTPAYRILQSEANCPVFQHEVSATAVSPTPHGLAVCLASKERFTRSFKGAIIYRFWNLLNFDHTCFLCSSVSCFVQNLFSNAQCCILFRVWPLRATFWITCELLWYVELSSGCIRVTLLPFVLFFANKPPSFCVLRPSGFLKGPKLALLGSMGTLRDLSNVCCCLDFTGVIVPNWKKVNILVFWCRRVLAA